MTALINPPLSTNPGAALVRAAQFPRLRYMGSKYKLLPHLAAVFDELGGTTALDAFSGSGVVSYLLKTQGYAVTSNDYLQFPTAIAKATVVNQTVTLTERDIDRICGKAADRRGFIQQTFDGLYFNAADRKFLDSAWSHIDRMTGSKRSLAISALLLSAARRQPRGVFTFTDSTKYADGRRDLQLSLREHFRERAAGYNAVIFNSGLRSTAVTGDVFSIKPRGWDVVYLDPPYAPPADDNDYIKRYHFLEGLACYWRGQTLMKDTKTKKIAKRFTPFAYKRTITDALGRLFKQFGDSNIVLSYSSNSVPDAETILTLMREVKGDVEVRRIDHRYSFGTHTAAARRQADEYIFIGR